MTTPSLTPAQILAAVVSVLGNLVALGWIDETTSQALASIASTLLPIALVFADAKIRKARAENLDAILRAKAILAEAARIAREAAEAAQAAKLDEKRVPQSSDVADLGPGLELYPDE